MLHKKLFFPYSLVFLFSIRSSHWWIHPQKRCQKMAGTTAEEHVFTSEVLAFRSILPSITKANVFHPLLRRRTGDRWYSMSQTIGSVISTNSSIDEQDDGCWPMRKSKRQYHRPQVFLRMSVEQNNRFPLGIGCRAPHPIVSHHRLEGSNVRLIWTVVSMHFAWSHVRKRSLHHDAGGENREQVHNFHRPLKLDHWYAQRITLSLNHLGGTYHWFWYTSKFPWHAHVISNRFTITDPLWLQIQTVRSYRYRWDQYTNEQSGQKMEKHLLLVVLNFSDRIMPSRTAPRLLDSDQWHQQLKRVRPLAMTHGWECLSFWFICISTSRRKQFRSE